MSDFEQKIKASLNADVSHLDANTREKLAAVRRKALLQPAKKPWLNKYFWLPAGSLALCGLLAIFILVKPKPQSTPANLANNQTQQQQSDALNLNQLAALELLENADDLDDAIDPDFYLWANEVLAMEDKPDAA